MTATTEAPQRFVGNGVPRKEDPELITGEAVYVDDLKLPGMAHMVVVRSTVAHARIAGVDTAAAAAMPGVVAVWSGRDLAGDWSAGLPTAWPVPSVHWGKAEPTAEPRVGDHKPVAVDKARFAGDPVAVVVAATREQAVDAAEAVVVDYEELPVVTGVEQALAGGAPLVHEALGTNELYTWRHSNGEDAEQLIASAPVVVRERYLQPRLVPNAIEPRAVLVQPSPYQGEYTLWTTTQVPHFVRLFMAVVCGLSEPKIRVIAPTVGGGFGSKLNVYAEEAIALTAARRLGRPVKWVEERSEAYQSTIQGRGQIQEIELAATQEGELLAVRARILADMGAYAQLVAPGIPLLGAFIYHGQYQARAYDFWCTAAYTNLPPTDAYRGAGRPEATYAIERAMDTLARRLGKDPAELRRMNMMPPFTEATPAAGGLNFDSGNYPALLDRAMEILGYEDVRAEQAERRRRGDSRLLGVGISTYIEMCGLAPSQVLSALNYAGGGWEQSVVRCLPTGKVEVVSGTSPHGQGHVTTWAQIVADELGVGYEDVEVFHGDTASSPMGLDTYGSRSLSVGGTALYLACRKVRDKAAKVAAHELEVAEEDLEWVEGRFQVRGAPDRARTIPELAASAWSAHDLPAGLEPVLDGEATWDPVNFTFPAGAHLCTVEVDTETGQVFVRRYVAVDDCGTIINPVIVQGQLHGGICQGIAEAQFEEAVFDENGVLLTGSMATYRVPAASEMPSFELEHLVTRSSTNPLGVKGIGEAGTIAAPAAVVNGVLDALAPLGVTHIEKPVNPERVWRAIQAARSAGGDRPTGEGSVQ
ncbi:MAG TPA: xanthine dehydrogenase family protein molybdopterin-binding subunit [Actinomycetes bacterium]|nr:xanthine dehydrogenase family protein molybdopterin-binding subunit [Actinomycetes bacterium]